MEPIMLQTRSFSAAGKKMHTAHIVRGHGKHPPENSRPTPRAATVLKPMPVAGAGSPRRTWDATQTQTVRRLSFPRGTYRMKIPKIFCIGFHKTGTKSLA